MSTRDEGHFSKNRYRADFYLFRHFLMALGSFRDDGVGSHEAMKLIFGVNRPFRIRLDGLWHETRAALLAGDTPHYLNGEDDWQIVIWVEAKSSLGILMEARTLEGRPFALHDVPRDLSMDEVIQTAGDDSDPEGALMLGETLLRVYGGTRAVPSNWDSSLKSIVSRVDSDPGNLTVRSLAAESGRREEELDRDFRRVVGMGAEDYIHRRKWMSYILLRGEGVDREKALRLCGLPGWQGLKERFAARYRLDLDVIESDQPFVRVYQGPEDQAALYL